MEVVERDSRRSLIRTFFASVAAAGAGMFGVAQAQAQTQTNELVKRTSSDNQPAGDKPPMFSGWATYGNLVFIAGKGEHTPGDITAHTTSVLNQLEAELKKDEATVMTNWIRRVKCVVGCRRRPGFSSCVTRCLADGRCCREGIHDCHSVDPAGKPKR